MTAIASLITKLAMPVVYFDVFKGQIDLSETSVTN